MFNISFFMLPFAQCCLIFVGCSKCVGLNTANDLTLEASIYNNNKWKVKIKIEIKRRKIRTQARDGVALNGEWTDSIVFIVHLFSGTSAWLAYAWKMLLMASIPSSNIVHLRACECVNAVHRHDTVLQCQHGEYLYNIVYIHLFRGSTG